MLFRSRCFFVPVQRFEIVAHELFVEGRRAAADTVRVDRPKARRIRRQNFVDERERTGRIDSELEFGVGDDDAACAGVCSGLAIQRERGVAHLCREFDADRPFGDRIADVLVVLADRRFRGRREQRLGQSLGLPQTLR